MALPERSKSGELEHSGVYIDVLGEYFTKRVTALYGLGTATEPCSHRLRVRVCLLACKR